jgi:hypothetical protein
MPMSQGEATAAARVNAAPRSSAGRPQVAGTGHRPPGHTGPGHTGPGHTGPGSATPGSAVPRSMQPRAAGTRDVAVDGVGEVSDVAQLLREVRADAAAVVAAADAARGRTASEGRTIPRHEVVRHVQILLDAVAAIVEGGTDGEQAIARAESVAADLAAQGVPLGVLLNGIQGARSVVLEGLIGRLRRYLDAEAVVAVLAALDALVAPVMTRMVVAHQEAERSLARTSTAARVKALRRLLATGDPTAAAELDLDPTREYHCLVADVSTPRECRSVEALIRTNDGVSGLVSGSLCRVTPLLPAASAVAQSDRPVLVVASPPVSVEDLPATHLLCRQAIEAGRSRGHTGLHRVGDYAVDVVMRAQPLLARFLTDELLARLDPGDPFHRQLAVTAHTYLSHGSRLDVTSLALHVHPNTVSHRLRRLGALTGFAHTDDGTDDFARTARWWWALDAWLARTSPGR